MRKPGRASVVGAMVTAVCLGTSAQASAGEQSVTIQIHDYVHVPGAPLQRAVDLVKRLYQGIGIRTDWMSTIRVGRFSVPRAKGRIATLNVIFLTREMAARGAIPAPVIGFAAVPRHENEGIGHIAYVIYDRVQAVAADASTDEVELLGVVMAHEIGHLLLPAGSHLEWGLMRGRWDLGDVRNLDRLNLDFPIAQAERIRNTLEGSALSAQ